MSSNSEENLSTHYESDFAVLTSCLVDGDPAQLARARRIRRRSLLISVVLQITALAALILVPILSKTEHIALANVMPMPPYYHAAATAHQARIASRPVVRGSGLRFCPDCRVVVHAPTSNNSGISDNDHDGIDIIPGRIDCPECVGLLPSANQPAIPRPAAPRVVHVTHLDPAMLIHRVEPVYPVLMKQIHREGTVELHAMIATDGSVESLQFIAGDPAFYQSALDAVRQWRYRPTVLNGNPVEVDTHITVIYKINR